MCLRIGTNGHSNDISGPIICGDFLVQLSSFKNLKQEFDPWHRLRNYLYCNLFCFSCLSCTVSGEISCSESSIVFATPTETKKSCVFKAITCDSDSF